jgi:MFS transporter, DHA1 family, tetracycline resistance protein
MPDSSSSERRHQRPPPSSFGPPARQHLNSHTNHVEDCEREEKNGECVRFLRAVAKERGCWILLIVAFLLALGIGAVVGLVRSEFYKHTAFAWMICRFFTFLIFGLDCHQYLMWCLELTSPPHCTSMTCQVPDTAADRYARLRHLYNGTDHCEHYDRLDKPEPCQQGGDDAQYSATMSNCGMNLLSFLLNPVLGSLSDARGRKPILLLSLGLSALPAVVLVLMLQVPAFRPFWYYATNATGGVNYFFGVVFAALSDVIPDPTFRASSFGLLLASFYGGFALGPSLSLYLTSQGVAMASLILIVLAFGVALLAMPETLSVDARRITQDQAGSVETRTRRARSAGGFVSGGWAFLSECLARPFREISILNQNTNIRLVAVGSFFGAMVYASDVTLVVYYIIEQLNVRSADLAQMFLLMGVVGIALQGGLLPPLIRLFRGETNLLVATFACGVVHNSLYGLATGKSSVLVALLLSQFTKLNFPILSSIASQTVSTHEQGRIQGALFATNAIASAFGPLSMEYVYGKTKSSPNWYGGPGTMFFYAALLQVAGTITVSYIHHKPTRENGDDDLTEAPETSSLLLRNGDGDGAVTASFDSDLEEPLLLETTRLATPFEGSQVGR